MPELISFIKDNMEDDPLEFQARDQQVTYLNKGSEEYFDKKSK